MVVVRLDMPVRIKYQLRHWLSVIEARQDPQIQTRVILVGTHLDKFDGPHREDMLATLRSAFQRLQIVDLIYLSCVPQQLESQKDFHNCLRATAAEIADGKLPLKYDAVRKVVEVLRREHDPPIVTLKDEQGGVWAKLLEAAPPEVVRRALPFLNYEGEVLWVGEHPQLANTLFITPQWVTGLLAQFVCLQTGQVNEREKRRFIAPNGIHIRLGQNGVIPFTELEQVPLAYDRELVFSLLLLFLEHGFPQFYSYGHHEGRRSTH